MKKKYIEEVEDLNEPCYLCEENITNDYCCIGKDKDGKLLHRHRKCKPTGKLKYK